jgi:hypothetical protein
MPGANGHVAASNDAQGSRQTRLIGAVQGAGPAAAEPKAKTPQLLLLPLPIDHAATELPGTYHPTHPLTLWMRAQGAPIGAMLVPVPEAVHQALLVLPPTPGR